MEEAPAKSADDLRPLAERPEPPGKEPSREPEPRPPEEEVERLRPWLYCYAGEKRKADLESLANVEAERRGHPRVKVRYFDLTLSCAMDRDEGSERMQVMDEIRAADYEVVWVESPYATWTRVHYERAGARPVRSRMHPWGFPWLQGKQKARAEKGGPSKAEVKP